MSQTELAPVLNDHRTILLVPNSGVQFLDFALSLPETNSKFELAYMAAQARAQSGAAGAAAEVPASRVISLVQRRQDSLFSIDGQPVPEDHVFTIDQTTIAAACEGRWFPLPYLRRIHGRDLLDNGPTNWVRCYLKRLAEPGPHEETHRLVVAVDTSINEAHGAYTAPTKDNISRNAEAFKFASVSDSLGPFLAGQAWLENWARRTCDCPEKIRKPEVLSDSSDADEHARFAAAYPFAIYSAFLCWLHKLIDLPELKFINTNFDESRVAEIPVDLVLDVGNSRTCGVLFEHVGDKADLANCYSMTLRDLSQPLFLHKGPFSSRMEFIDFYFGDEFSSNMNLNVSQHHAFAWCSMVRVGPEAQRLAGQSFGNEGEMGLSSPKRYIWDTEPSVNTWYLNLHGQPQLAGPPDTDQKEAAKGDFAMSFTESGERISDSNPYPVVTPRYSRSAMMTYFLAELFLQAFNQINAPYVRYNRKHLNRHRRIRRIVLTVPTAMTLEERLLFERRARDAQEVLWSVLGQDDVKIELLNQWDEAVATQAVYLYNETRANFMGNTTRFFEQDGRERDLPRSLVDKLDDQRITQSRVESAPSLRVASLDIGGGTTDLIVTTYYLVDRRIIVPHQEFREGFNVAGDDILGSIIQKLILPKLVNGLTDSGADRAIDILGELVGGDREGATVASDHSMRRQFSLLALIPAAIRLISAYEDGYNTKRDATISMTLGSLVTGMPDARAMIEAHLKRKNDYSGRQMPLSPFDVALNFSSAEVDTAVRGVIDTVMSDLAEAVYAHQCDTLLLSGRPSCMPAVRDLLLMNLPIPPHRVIAMHDYVVDAWYPFRDFQQRINDPKTTVSVGAMVCAMSKQLEGFFMLSDRLQLRSTVRFIGEVNGFTMDKDKVIFEDVDLDDEDLGGGEREKTIPFTSPMRIGFRQMRHPRWQTTPYYELQYSRTETFGGGTAAPPPPYYIVLRLQRPTAAKPRAIVIAAANDRFDRSVRDYVQLRLNTLPSFGPNQERHWLDAGIFDLRLIGDMAQSMRGS